MRTSSSLWREAHLGEIRGQLRERKGLFSVDLLLCGTRLCLCVCDGMGQIKVVWTIL